LAISTKQNTIQICSINNGKLLKTLKEEHPIINLHVNHMRNLLLSVTANSCIFWSLSNYDKSKYFIQL